MCSDKVVALSGTRIAKAEIAEALSDYQWAMIEAKNILQCISIACSHGEAVAEDLQPSIECAVDGVARLLKLVHDKWDGVESAAREEVLP